MQKLPKCLVKNRVILSIFEFVVQPRTIVRTIFYLRKLFLEFSRGRFLAPSEIACNSKNIKFLSSKVIILYNIIYYVSKSIVSFLANLEERLDDQEFFTTIERKDSIDMCTMKME